MACIRLLTPRRARRLWLGPVMALVLAGGIAGVAPGVAAAQGVACPDGDPTYTNSCGPSFVMPQWGDAGGWTDPSKFSTIQLADLNGDGKDELLARNDQGLEIYWFDTDLGQWSPQVDASGVPQVLTDFRSPLPNERLATDWTRPEYHTTIQTAHINGNPNAQVLARFADGMRVYYFSPGPGGSINGGSWSLISQGGPFGDADGWNAPSRYFTIRTGDFDVSDPGKTELVGRGPDGLVGYKWNGSGWSPLPVKTGGADTTYPDNGCGSGPSCYALFRMARPCAPASPNCPTGRQAVIGRGGLGVNVERYDSGGGGSWSLLPGSASIGSTKNANRVFGDLFTLSPDCPFGGSGGADCLGSSPTYYETFGVADLDGDGADEVFARAADGLRVKKLDVAAGTWTALPTLKDLAGAASSLEDEFLPGLWGSIRTANIDGRAGDEVLALDLGGELAVWSYDPGAKSWQRWQPSTALALTDNWLGHPEYYATIRTGDVDGDGHDDVVARGQFGIRTWFYNRRGTGGWERYLAGGYPAFPGTPPTPGQPGTGQAAAYAKLSELAKGITNSDALRDAWTTGNKPDKTILDRLQSDLPNPLLGNCSNQTVLEPPRYASCTPPAEAGAFFASEWTAVVNEMLLEAYLAEKVAEYFEDLDTIRQGVFESQTGALPAIAGDLQIAGAAGNTTDFNLNGTFAAVYGIAASLAALVPGGEAVSAGLWVASEGYSALPSESPTANSSFSTTYDGLLDKVAKVQDDMVTALSSQRQQVLNDSNLLRLVGQLRASGTWKVDTNAVQSASRQAFALTTYQTLLPTMFPRYDVTNCTTQSYLQGTLTCDLPTGPYVVTSQGGLHGTWVGPEISRDPCAPTGYYDTLCDYGSQPGTIPDSVGSIVWGAVSRSCTYSPDDLSRGWKFGCSLGVPVATSILADSPDWKFPTHSGNPVVRDVPATVAASGVVRASASSARAPRRGANAVPVRDMLEPLRFTGRVRLTGALRLGRMRVVVDRTLFEHGRREELARSGSRRRLRPFALRQVRDGVFTSRRRGAPRVRLRLRRLEHHRKTARFDLRLARVRTRDIRALCAVLPARVSSAGRPLELQTRLRLRDGAVRSAIAMRQSWRCVRDRKGEFSGIRPIKPKPPAARPGLAVHLRAPRVSASGRRATVRVTVSNRRRARPSRVVSSLWQLRITGTAGGRLRTVRAKELRAGRSHIVRLTVPVPRRARGRVCVRVAVSAASARGDTARRCARR